MSPDDTARRSNVPARYNTPHGGRMVCARVKHGQTFLTDEPTSGHGRVFPVDVVPASDGPEAVEAIVELYLEDARSSCSIPMAHTILDVDLVEVAA